MGYRLIDLFKKNVRAKVLRTQDQILLTNYSIVSARSSERIAVLKQGGGSRPTNKKFIDMLDKSRSVLGFFLK